MKDDYDFPWYVSVSILFYMFILLVIGSEMNTPGYWAEHWWPVCRLFGGFTLVLVIIDAALGGPRRRSNARYRREAIRRWAADPTGKTRHPDGF